MITCMKMKSFILKYASKIMFYDVNIACYQLPREGEVAAGDVRGTRILGQEPNVGFG